MDFKNCSLFIFFAFLCLIAGCLSAHVRLSGERRTTDQENPIDTFNGEGYVLPRNGLSLHCYTTNAVLASTVKWYKVQEGPEVAMAFDNYVQEPFLSKGRFRAVMRRVGEADLLSTLTISEVTIEDTGRYICRYEDSENVASKSEETIEISVGEQYSVRMFAKKVDSLWSEEHEFRTGEVLKLSEGDEWNVRCEFRSGHPIPHINITLDTFDITNRFDVEITTRLVQRHPDLGETGSTDGLNYIENDVIYTSRDPLIVSHISNRRNLTCSSFLPELKPSATYVTPSLQFAPVIKCMETVITVDEMRPASFQCLVKADPLIDEVHWSWNTTLGIRDGIRPGMKVGRYHAKFKQGSVSDEQQHTLDIDSAFIQTFHAYELVARNKQGTKSKILTLKLGNTVGRGTAIGPLAAIPIGAAIVSLLFKYYYGN